uniref:Uncharacterized protein n=1 Tax=Cucumis melo TaxID=3656 RepID=A0A9I9E7U8_CUCME
MRATQITPQKIMGPMWPPLRTELLHIDCFRFLKESVERNLIPKAGRETKNSGPPFMRWPGNLDHN